MTTQSKIEWTETTWNPLGGCSIASPGCKNCYAARMAKRLAAMGQKKYIGTTEDVKGVTRFNGVVNLDLPALNDPFHWRKPRIIFVNSMSDLFHNAVDDAFIDLVFAVMALTPHTYQVLTKRIGRAASYLSKRSLGDVFSSVNELDHQQAIGSPDLLVQNALAVHNSLKRTDPVWPLQNVLIGPSIESQTFADERAPYVKRIATLGWRVMLSLEPLLGPLDLSELLPSRDTAESDLSAAVAYCNLCGGEWEFGTAHTCRRGVQWAIVGGESGPGARPCNIKWIRSVVEQCKAAAVPCFVKQLGALSLSPYYDVEHEQFRERILDGRHRILMSHNGSYAEWNYRDGQPPPGTVIEWHPGKKGGDVETWPEDLRLREFPRVRAYA